MQQGYKSLLLVAVMGGFLLFMAGVLLRTDQHAKKVDARKVETLPSMHMSIGGAPQKKVVEAKPDAQFTEKFLLLRKTLSTGDRNDPAVKKEVVNLLALLTSSATTAEWSLVKAEAAKKPYPEGFETVLVAVAGATKHEEAVPFIVERLKAVPTKAIDALRAHGSHAAFDELLRIFRDDPLEGMRFLALSAFQGFPPEWTEGVHIAALGGEKNREIRFALITQMRIFASDAAADALTAHAATLGKEPADVDEALRTFNSLSGMKSVHAHEAILRFFGDEKMPEPTRRAAGQSLRFLIDPALNEAVVEALVQKDLAVEDLVLFLGRNLRPKDKDLLAAARVRAKNAELVKAIDELIAAVPAK